MMTVPQQLEAFSLEDNPALMVAVKHGKLPFCAEQGIMFTKEHISLSILCIRYNNSMHSD